MIFEHVNRLAARGHDVWVVNDGPNTPGWYGKLDAIVVPRKKFIEWAAPMDVVVATGCSTAYWASTIPSARYYYFIQMMEHVFFSEGSSQYRLALASYSHAHEQGFKLYTIAKWLSENLADEFGIEGTPVVPNGVNKEHFHQEFYSVMAEVPRYIVLEGDNRNPAKDTEGMAWAVGEVLRKEFGVEVWGYAAYRHGFTDKMDKFIVRPTYQQMRNLYSNAQFLLKTSHFEGRACAPVEAMSCGTATVRGIVHGDDDLINGFNCLRSGYEYDDVLHNARWFLGDKKLRRRLRKNCREYAASELDWDPIIDTIQDLYAS